MEITIGDHPSKNEHGKPLFPHARGVRVDGRLVAYINIDEPGRPLNFIGTFAQELCELVHTEVQKLLGHDVGAVSIPPKGLIAATAEDDDDEEE